MATSKAGAEQAAAPARPKAKPNQPTPQNFTKAYVEWIHQQQQTALDYQRQCTEAYLKLVNTLNDIAAAAQRPIVEAHRKLSEAGSAAGRDRNAAQTFQQLQQDFARVVTEASQDTSHQELAQKAYQTYAEATRRAAEAAQEQNVKAYQRYFRVVRDAWSDIDPENPDPTQLRALESATKIAFQAGAY